MVSRRPGVSTRGCLFSLLIVAALAYFGVAVGAPFLRYYQFRDAMQQEARFAARKTDEQIVTTLKLKADSLGLPSRAHNVHVSRTVNRITIWAEYEETVEFPYVTRDIDFRPVVEGTF
ncbi:MAG TPA: hypothetical protein VFU01_17640 [Gemmatimonadaceae bacterium]|nr:hypothetical protein [Gemmatimonadaceae bacterium]